MFGRGTGLQRPFIAAGPGILPSLAALAMGEGCDRSVPTFVTSCATIRWFSMSAATWTL